MSQPTVRTLLDEAESEGPGESMKMRAHPQIGFFVKCEGIDPEADALEVRLEVSDNDEHYAPISKAVPRTDDVFTIDESHLVQSDADGDVYVAYLSGHNFIAEYIRPNFLEQSGSYSLTVEVYLSGWTQRGAQFDYLEG